MQPTAPLDEVYTIEDWYDGPRAGFASYRGCPCHYRATVLPTNNTAGDDEEYFELVQVSDETLRLAIEASEIFHRWDTARRQGVVPWRPGDAHGALPEDRDRYQELRAILAPYERGSHSRARVVRGEFTFDSSRVRWIDAVDDPPSNER